VVYPKEKTIIYKGRGKTSGYSSERTISKCCEAILFGRKTCDSPSSSPVSHHAYDFPKRRAQILEEFYIYLKTEKGLAESTSSMYVKCIQGYLKKGYKITVNDAKKYYLKKLKTTMSTYYHKNVCYALKHFFKMHDIELPIKSPKLDEKRREHLSYRDALIFLNSIEDIRDKTMVMLQLETGLRPGEVLNLELNDLDLENGTIAIKKTKTKMDRIVYIKTRLIMILERYLVERGQSKHKKLFLCENKDAPLSLYRYQRLLQIYSKKSGIKATSYMFRHTFATLFIRNGGDIKALKEIMGHKKIETTERYIHEDEERIREQALKHAPEF